MKFRESELENEWKEELVPLRVSSFDIRELRTKTK